MVTLRDVLYVGEILNHLGRLNVLYIGVTFQGFHVETPQTLFLRKGA